MESQIEICYEMFKGRSKQIRGNCRERGLDVDRREREKEGVEEREKGDVEERKTDRPRKR